MLFLGGDASLRRGPDRSIGYRWFTDPLMRVPYSAEEQHYLSRVYAAGLRSLMALRGPDSKAAGLAELLLGQSAEFRELWQQQEVGLQPPEVKRFHHPEVGVLELSCQTLLDPDQSHRLLVYTAVPGSESYEKLQMLAVIGTRTLLS